MHTRAVREVLEALPSSHHGYWWSADDLARILSTGGVEKVNEEIVLKALNDEHVDRLKSAASKRVPSEWRTISRDVQLGLGVTLCEAAYGHIRCWLEMVRDGFGRLQIFSWVGRHCGRGYSQAIGCSRCWVFREKLCYRQNKGIF